MFALQSGFLDKPVGDRAADLCLILYISSSMVIGSLLLSVHRVLDGLAYATPVFRPKSHLVALVVLTALFAAPAYLIWMVVRALADDEDGDSSEAIWTVLLVSSNIMNCCKATSNNAND